MLTLKPNCNFMYHLLYNKDPLHFRHSLRRKKKTPYVDITYVRPSVQL
jgi:hypothetical protein